MSARTSPTAPPSSVFEEAPLGIGGLIYCCCFLCFRIGPKGLPCFGGAFLKAGVKAVLGCCVHV